MKSDTSHERFSDEDYYRLLEFRTALRRFMQESERRSAEAGITATQHQLLVVIRGFPDERGPSVSDVAKYMLVRHHSAVELVSRAVANGLVQRKPDADDRRTTRLRVTARGNRILESLTEANMAELAAVAESRLRLTHLEALD